MYRVMTTPWGDTADLGWTVVERAEYERARLRSVEASGGRAGPPAAVRETLLSMTGDRPDDEELRRELARLADDGGSSS